jgi:hypothetical protein
MSEKVTEKNECHVKITMEEDKFREGFLFLGEDERLVDVLNDDRMFLPFKSEEGQFSVLKKTSIIEISMLREGSKSRLAKW